MAERTFPHIQPEPALANLLAELDKRFGEAIDAIVLYGSYLRGDRKAMPDLYVFLNRYPASPALDRWLGSILPPNVYCMADGELRAKVSVMRTKQLLNAVTMDFHPYFWARFAQPCQLLQCRDDPTRACFAHITEQSTRHLLAAMGSPASLTTSAAYWQALFKRTYAAELRSERPDRYRQLHRANSTYYDALFEARPIHPDRPIVWWLRQAVGKVLSAARLIKSALTFTDPVGYLLWKLERHSGVRLEATQRQRRYPFLFAWPLIWRLYRAKAFR